MPHKGTSHRRSGRTLPAGAAGRDASAAALVALLAVCVARRVRGGFFAPDDLVVLESARGLLPPFPAPWRWLSGTVYPALASAVFGLDPAGYLTVNLALHGANAALLFVWSRTLGLDVPAALLAAGLFAASPLAFYPLHQMVGAGELMALGLTLDALIVIGRSGARQAIVAGFLFAAALLSKESVALLPAVLLLPAPDAGPLRARAQRASVLLSLSLVAGVVLVATGAARSAFGGSAYRASLGTHMGSHLLLYASWAADYVHPSPGAVATMTWGTALAGALVLSTMAFAAAWTWRSRGPGTIGLAWFLLGIGPVLPLVSQIQVGYVYTPLAGIAIAIAALAGHAAERFRWAQVATWAGAIAIITALALRADALAARRYDERAPGSDSPMDPWLRKCASAEHVIADVGRGLGDGPVRVVMFLPPELQHVYSARTSAEVAPQVTLGLPRYLLAREVTDDGRALRLFHPDVTDVAWTDAWQESLTAGAWFLIGAGAHATALGRGLAAQANFARMANDGGMPALARRHLESVLRDQPGDARTRFEYGRALAALGERDGARRELTRVLEMEPDPETATLARDGLQQLLPPRR